MSKSYDDFLSSKSTSQPPSVLPVYQKTRPAHPGAVLLTSRPTAWDADTINEKANTNYSVFNDPLDFNYLSSQSNVGNLINGNGSVNPSTGTSTQTIPPSSLTNLYNPANGSSNIASTIDSIAPIPILPSTSISDLNSPRSLYLDAFNHSLPSNAPDLFQTTNNHDMQSSSMQVQGNFALNNQSPAPPSSSVSSSLSSSSLPPPSASASGSGSGSGSSSSSVNVTTSSFAVDPVTSSEMSQQHQQKPTPQHSHAQTTLNSIFNLNDGNISQSINKVCSWVSTLTPAYQSMLMENLLSSLSPEVILHTKLKIDTILAATHGDQAGLPTYNSVVFPQKVITSVSSASSSPLSPSGFATNIRVSSLGRSLLQNPPLQSQPKPASSDLTDQRQANGTRRSRKRYNLQHPTNQHPSWSPLPPQFENYRRDARSRSEGPTNSSVRRIAEDVSVATSASVSASPIASPSASPSSSHSPSPLIAPQQLASSIHRSSTPTRQQLHQQTSTQIQSHTHLYPFSHNHNHNHNYNRSSYMQSGSRGGLRQAISDDKLQTSQSSSSSFRNTNLTTVPATAGATGAQPASANSMNPKNLTDPVLLKNIPLWLKSLRLHKYSPILSKYNWLELIALDEATLEECGVAALGARRKLLRVFNIVKDYKDRGLIDQSAFDLEKSI